LRSEREEMRASLGFKKEKRRALEKRKDEV
jgi:hypothetical protein